MGIPKCPTCGIEYKADTTAYSPNCNCGNIFTQIFEMKDSHLTEVRLLRRENDRYREENKTLKNECFICHRMDEANAERDMLRDVLEYVAPTLVGAQRSKAYDALNRK